MPLGDAGRAGAGGEPRPRQNFTPPRRPEKLKTWNPDALLGVAAARISVFQDFRFSPLPATPEILPTGHGRGLGCERHERQVCAHKRTFRCGEYKLCRNGEKRPEVAVQKRRMYGENVLFPVISMLDLDL